MSSVTLDEVWALFRQVAESQREVAEAQKETDRKFQDTDRKFQENAAAQKETDRQLKQVGKQIGELGNRLGEFVEGLVKPAVVRLFRDRGIEVHEVHADIAVNRHDEGIQIDLLVVNDTEAVLVEVKSKLAQADVDDRLDRWRNSSACCPAMATCKPWARSRRWSCRRRWLVTPMGQGCSCWRKPATA